MDLYTTPFGKFLLEPDDLVSNELINGRFWEKELLPVFDMLPRDSVVIEVGSYIGDHTVILSKRCSRVIAIEGSIKNYYKLCANLLLNDCYNVTTYNKCVGNADGYYRIASKEKGDMWYPTPRNNAGTRFVKKQGYIYACPFSCL